MARRTTPSVLPVAPPSRLLGVVCAIVVVASTPRCVFPLREIAPVVSLGVVYLVAVLLISTVWGAWLGHAHGGRVGARVQLLPHPADRALHDRRRARTGSRWSCSFVAVIGSSAGAGRPARGPPRPTQRRREADLAAEMARLLLRGDDSRRGAAGRRAAARDGARACRPRRSSSRRSRPTSGSVAFPLRDGTTPARHAPRAGGPARGVAATPPGAGRAERSRRCWPPRVERDRLLGEVVETRALRRSDVVKTTLLRAVSHDLRTPLTAIVAAGEALALADASATTSGASSAA